MHPDQLNRQFGLPGLIRFEPGHGQLTRAIIASPEGAAESEIYLYGANVTHFQPRGSKPVLWMSRKAEFVPGKPIRGGVPLCFPWFGPKADDPSAPIHGLARLNEWKIDSVSQAAASTDVTLSLELGNTYVLRFTVRTGRELSMELEVTNVSEQLVVFEEALHSYFAVGDVRQATVTGLENTRFLSRVPTLQTLEQGSQPVVFTGETDRIYLDTQAPCVIHDPVLGRQIAIRKRGSDATVVWNPWIAKAKAMPDFGDEEWPEMLCVETCNVKEHAIRLDPGQSHTIQATISLA